MSIFNIFNRNKETSKELIEVEKPSIILPEIPEKIFVEATVPQLKTDVEKSPVPLKPQSEKGIKVLLQFLAVNHESKGYDDALINPDNSHLQQNLDALKKDLERTILEVKLFYNDFIRLIDFHISSRGRSGMIDMVEELQVKKDTAVSHVNQILEIETSMQKGEGPGQSVLISYTRGFKNGLAAISVQTIINQNF